MSCRRCTYRAGWCSGNFLDLFSQILCVNFLRVTRFPDWDFSCFPCLSRHTHTRTHAQFVTVFRSHSVFALEAGSLNNLRSNYSVAYIRRVFQECGRRKNWSIWLETITINDSSTSNSTRCYRTGKYSTYFLYEGVSKTFRIESITK
jgi:hypothetical protein